MTIYVFSCANCVLDRTSFVMVRRNCVSDRMSFVVVRADTRSSLKASLKNVDITKCDHSRRIHSV